MPEDPLEVITNGTWEIMTDQQCRYSGYSRIRSGNFASHLLARQCQGLMVIGLGETRPLYLPYFSSLELVDQLLHGV